MPTFTDLVAAGNTQTVTSETAMDSSGGTASPYAPVVGATLVGVYARTSTLVAAGKALSGYLRLQCPTFGGVDCIIPIGINQILFTTSGATSSEQLQGIGVWTQVNLPVQTGSNIKVIIKFTAAPVSPLTDIYFCFQK